MILECKNCKPSPFEDKRYGKNMRVHNPCKPGSPVLMFRCANCGRERAISVKHGEFPAQTGKKGKKK